MPKAFFGIIVLFAVVAATAVADRPLFPGRLASPVPEAATVSPRGMTLVQAPVLQRYVLTVSTPSGLVLDGEFTGREAPLFEILGDAGLPLEDGSYTYEVKPVRTDGQVRDEWQDEGPIAAPRVGEALSGSFQVENGVMVQADVPEEAVPYDVVHADDVITTGSLCVGFDCLTDGTENFGFDTIKLKENNLQIFFDDTSTTAGFPANDWRIVANDTSSGGANYLAIQDVTAARVPFQITAGAPTNSLFVSSSGRLGLGTATPVMKIQAVLGDSPGLRLDQDASSGWTAQSWDVVGNESNFFIRDVTGGSKLPLRIQPGTPTNTVTMKADGAVGLGTWSPSASLEVQRTAEDAELLVNRTDGASAVLACSDVAADLGTENNFPVNFVVNGYTAMTIGTNGYLGVGVNNPTRQIDVAGGAYCDGNSWVDASSRSLKRDIVGLSESEARQALSGMTPVKYFYRNDAADQHVGFIAEDVPALVATADRKGMSPMDVVAVLTRVVQAQERTLGEQQETIRKLEARLSRLEQ